MGIIKSFKPKNSTEYEAISCRILKLCAHTINKPFSDICKSAMKSSTYPKGLKNSTVNLIYKKGDKINMMNYRPISLLTFSKILEIYV
jgi:hypothetical protein